MALCLKDTTPSVFFLVNYYIFGIDGMMVGWLLTVYKFIADFIKIDSKSV